MGPSNHFTGSAVIAMSMKSGKSSKLKIQVKNLAEADTLRVNDVRFPSSKNGREILYPFSSNYNGAVQVAINTLSINT